MHFPPRPLRPLGVLLLSVLGAVGTLGCSSGGDGSSDSETAGTRAEAPSDAAGTPSPDSAPSPTSADADAPANMDQSSAASAPSSADPALETATFGAGCFWCTEAVLEQVDGVHDVVSGYMGGKTPDPTYREVCTGTTGHAEVVQVHFDPAVLPYEHLLAWFWKLHDPTTLNRQGADVGTQYRSAIFTHSEGQAEEARRSLEAAQSDFDDPIVTEITPASSFYPAEDYHQDYYRANRSAGYCRAVIAPKLEKLDLEK